MTGRNDGVPQLRVVQDADPLVGEPGSMGAAETPSAGGLGMLMAELARELQAIHNSVDDTLAAITQSAVAIVPGTSFACITSVTRKQGVNTISPTDVRAEKINAIQETVGQGPCLESLWESTTIRVEDLRDDQRWPMYALAAVDLGILSMMTLRLYVDNLDLGALSLYSEQAGAFTDESESVASLLATHAAVALTAAEQQANLEAAVDSRDIIGQAKGVLMERYQLDPGRAFRLLVRVSQTTNRPLRAVAEELLSTGEMPTVDRVDQ